MPKSRAEGRDYSNCTFRTLLTNLPPGVQHMLTRALGSLGSDLNVMKRWTEPVITPNGSKLEREFFPHASNDICCADGVGFCLYQTGVVDVGRNTNLFRYKTGGNIHWADYYGPHDNNDDICYLVQQIPNTIEMRDIDFRTWLPGDYFLYFDAGKPGCAAHINIYLGDYVETVDGEDLSEQVYCMWNSSLGTTGGNAYCTAAPFSWHLNYCKKVGRGIHHCRIRAIERLFQNMLGPPLALKDTGDSPKPGEPASADVPWLLSEKADAPYPVGRNLTWHDGVHFPQDAALQSDAVQAFAPGVLAQVRFGKRTDSTGDTSFVMVRHRFLPAQIRVLGPPPADAAQDDPGAKDAKPFYSLYTNLAPLERYLKPGTEITGGVPELNEQAPGWLRKVWLKPKPKLIQLIPDTAPLTLLALTRSAPGAAPKLATLCQPRGLTAQHSVPLEGLASQTIDGKQYWFLKVEPNNAGIWDQKVPPSTVPRARPLAFYNPLTGAAFTTKLRVPGTTPLAHAENAGQYSLEVINGADGNPVTGPDGTLVQVAAFTRPGLRISHFHEEPEETDNYDFDPESSTLTFHDDVRQLVLYANTAGEGDKRILQGQYGVDVAKGIPAEERKFKVKERATTGSRTHTTDNLWLDLTPGVWLRDAEMQHAQNHLNDQATLDAIKERLESGQSCLVGVMTTRKGGWELRDNYLSPSEQGPEEGPLLLYRRIHGQSWYPKFDEPPKHEADQDHELTLAVEISSDVAILPLLKPHGAAHNGVFEVIFAASDTGTNQAELDAVDRENQARLPLVRKLLDGQLVELAAEDQVAPADRQVSRETIGNMGDIPAALGAKGYMPGVHFSIFSGENLVDASVTGADDSIAPVPNTGWLVLKDSSSNGFFSPDFVKKVLKRLIDYPREHLIDLTELKPALEQDGVIQPAEWLAFCKSPGNHRVLSRLIAAHVPEWKVDWSSEVKTDGTREMQADDGRRQALADHAKEFRWWQGVNLDGITGDTVFFYHPLRFIEWLNTGLDIMLGGVAGAAKPKVKLKLLEGGGEVIELPPDAADPNLFRFRTLVGEARSQATAEVTLENVPTATDTLQVIIHRGEVRNVRLVQPVVNVQTQSVQPALNYAVPVSQSPFDPSPSAVYLLADGDAHLKESGYSRVLFVFTVNYNVRIPNTIAFKLSGSGFTMALNQKTGLSGAKWANFSGSNTSANGTVAEADDSGNNGAGNASMVGSAKSYSVTVEAVAVTTTVPAQAKLEATFSGGDLPNEITKTCNLATHEIAPTQQGKAKRENFPRGKDVAKVQLYLSQLFAEDDLPCLTGLGHRDKQGKEAMEPAKVDGVYGKSLAKALWRFIYTFGQSPSYKIRSIQIRDRAGHPKGEATHAELRAPDRPGSARARRTDDVAVEFDDYPVINAALISEIVRQFQPPFVLPSIDLLPQSTLIPPSGRNADNLSVRADWNQHSTGQTAIIPLANGADGFAIKAVWKEAQVEKHGDLSVRFVLPETSAYRFATGPGLTTTVAYKLRALLANPSVALVSSGLLTTKTEDNTLRLTTEDGRLIGAVKLVGARDLTKAQSDSCRDAALVQWWLSRIPDPGTQGKIQNVYKSTDSKGNYVIDGKWGRGSLHSLQLFKKLHPEAGSDWPSLVAAIYAAAHAPQGS